MANTGMSIEGVVGPMISGSFSLVAGDLMGTFIDHTMAVFEERTNIVSVLGFSSNGASMLRNGMSIFFQVGLISLGTHFVSNAFPWLTRDASAFTLYMMGLWSTSERLRKNLTSFNSVFTEPSEIRTSVISETEQGSVKIVPSAE
jgi:hypothetical protein